MEKQACLFSPLNTIGKGNFKMKTLLITSATLTTVAPVAFANTNSGATFWVCSTPQNSDLDQTGFEALTWVQVSKVGSHGETGSNQNVVTYDTWDTKFSDKAKGIANAGDPEVEVSEVLGDAGQAIMDQAGDALNQNKYAFKIVRNDAPAGGTPSILYNRGIVTGPVIPNGRNEDFQLKMYTLGLVQGQIVVPAAEPAP